MAGNQKDIRVVYTAGRNVNSGLTAASVVSSWPWAATLLQSSIIAYQYGISGPFWYAAAARIQIILFAILAIEMKRKAPSSHTFPEVIYHRIKKNVHVTSLFFGLMTNTIVTAMLILGGAAVVSSLTGINNYVAAFPMPVGVIIYMFFGGLKATFLAMNHSIQMYDKTFRTKTIVLNVIEWANDDADDSLTTNLL